MRLRDCIKWLLGRRAEEPAPAPEIFPEDQPLWVEIDGILRAAGVSAAVRELVSLRVDNAVLRRENRELRLQELHRLAEANLAVHKPVHKPRPVRPRPPVNGPANKAKGRNAYMREYMRKRGASPRLVSRDGVVLTGGDVA